MKHIKELNLNENHSQENLIQFVQNVIDDTYMKGGNGMMLNGLLNVAESLEDYSVYAVIHHPGEQGYYTPETINMFKEFVLQMAKNELDNPSNTEKMR